MREEFKSNLDTSGKMFRKNYLEKYHMNILEDILKFVFTYKLNEIPFKQQVYHWYNDIKNIQLCYCGERLKFKNSNIGYSDFCSKQCMNKSENIKERRKQTNIEKYGTNTPCENKTIKEKLINTNLEKYGYKSPIQNDKIKEKSQKTLFYNFGVLIPTKSEEVINKIKKTNLEKYGVENVKQNYEINEKIKKTNLEKYGVEYAMKNDIIKSKSKSNLLIKLKENIIKYYKEYNIIDIDFENKEYTIKCNKNHIFKINYTLLNSRRRTNTIICTECNPINSAISGLEIELLQFIQDNYNGIIHKNHKGLGIELDIYLPELKLAFEFNGLWWHNELNKPKYFHKNKTDICNNNNIQLIHIWEDDWLYKNNIVKSMILNKIGKTNNKIYARNCEIREVDKCKKFLTENHIQGYTNSTIKLGLFYNDELVSLMTFGKKRIVMNDKNTDDEWELSRFCNKINNNIVGSASKLLKYFIIKYKPLEIITYADKSYSNGNLYKVLGFDFLYNTEPNYYYIVDKIRKHRFMFRKNKLIKDGYDKEKSEHEIMLERKIYRIYNSGNEKYVLKNQN